MEHGKVAAGPVRCRVAVQRVDPGACGNVGGHGAGEDGGANILVGGHVDILYMCVCVCVGGGGGREVMCACVWGGREGMTCDAVWGEGGDDITCV